MKWIKKGLVFNPNGQFDWVNSHSMLPIAESLKDDIFRVYFSGRDVLNRSLVGYVEFDINNHREIIKISKNPILSLGELGTFDDNGVTPSWIINHNGKKYLYYVGWNKGSTVRMAEMAGLAVSTDGGENFKRISRAPILKRTDQEPFLILAATCVIIENDIWRMWYVSGVKWIHKDLIHYTIKYAESKNGIEWDQTGLTCLEYSSDKEWALARPCVIKEDGFYKMWYCFKEGENNYRIGYAESLDGLKWDRKDDEVGIDVSESGWDSEMICYPYVFNHNGKKFLLYNGNGYGRTGFGLAELQ